jgi:hypothetical protein
MSAEASAAGRDGRILLTNRGVLCARRMERAFDEDVVLCDCCASMWRGVFRMTGSASLLRQRQRNRPESAQTGHYAASFKGTQRRRSGVERWCVDLAR